MCSTRSFFPRYDATSVVVGRATNPDPCVIAASETAVSTKTGVRDGSVLMDQHWLQWVNKLLSQFKAGDREERIWNFDYPAAATMFNTATVSFQSHRHDHTPMGRAGDPGPCGTASHGLGLGGFFFFVFWITVQKASVVSGWKRGQQRCAPYCSQVCWDKWTLQCFRTKTCASKGLPHHAQSVILLVTTPDNARPSRLSFVLAMVSHHERTTFPENTSFEWNGIFTERVKECWYGSP